ncbi:hypothetical protein AAFF_G00314210 [Aldrovandia affinis]|uniref:Uncharacterized protein n=1 Tax=Aldrovandia affinis TaxID=143900 RepID=A0AAD7R7S5_9TELE|nr:hypothetical protein AAFF_G00314210 [Aldrovandia affinis]
MQTVGLIHTLEQCLNRMQTVGLIHTLEQCLNRMQTVGLIHTLEQCLNRMQTCPVFKTSFRPRLGEWLKPPVKIHVKWNEAKPSWSKTLLGSLWRCRPAERDGERPGTQTRAITDPCPGASASNTCVKNAQRQ